MFARTPNERGALSGNSVTLVSCGSVGSAMAEMLVRAGIGKLTLVVPRNYSDPVFDGSPWTFHILEDVDLAAHR